MMPRSRVVRSDTNSGQFGGTRVLQLQRGALDGVHALQSKLSSFFATSAGLLVAWPRGYREGFGCRGPHWLQGPSFAWQAKGGKSQLGAKRNSVLRSWASFSQGKFPFRRPPPVAPKGLRAGGGGGGGGESLPNRGVQQEGPHI